MEQMMTNPLPHTPTFVCLICGLDVISNSYAKEAIKIRELNLFSKTKIFDNVCNLFQLKAYNSCYKHILSKAQLCDKCLIISRDISSMLNVILRAEVKLTALLTHLKSQWMSHAKRLSCTENDLSVDIRRIETMTLPEDYDWTSSFSAHRLAQLVAEKVSCVTASKRPKVRDTIPRYFAAKIASIEIVLPPDVGVVFPSQNNEHTCRSSSSQTISQHQPGSTTMNLASENFPVEPEIGVSTATTLESQNSTALNIDVIDMRRKQLREEYGLSKDPFRRKKCRQCGVTFPSSCRLENHILVIHEGVTFFGSYFCFEKGCGRLMKSKVEFDVHQTSQHNEVDRKTYICQTCGSAHPTQKRLANHLRSVHDFYRDAFPYYCDTCDAAFTIESDFKAHIDLHAASHMPFQCLYCGESFKKDVLLRCHTLNAHRTEAKVFKCERCSKILPSANSYRKHLATHYTLKCDQCDYRVDSIMELKRHKKALHPKDKMKRYPCRSCDKSYPKRNLLLKHEKEEHRSNLKVVYKCTQCEKQYSTKPRLKVHMDALHNDSCIAVCPHCSKKFPHKAYLAQHLRGHCSAVKSSSPKLKKA